MANVTQIAPETRKRGVENPPGKPASRPATPLRITPGSAGVSIWSFALFGDPDSAHVRDFLSRVFSVGEVESVEINHARAFARVHFEATENAPAIWRKLSRSLKQTVSPRARKNDGLDSRRLPLPGLDNLFLHSPFPKAPIRIHRVGTSVSTWRLDVLDEHRVRISHPALRRRRDIAYRLEQELANIIGVEAFRANLFNASITIRIDPRILSPEKLVRHLERSWPRLLEETDAPLPVRKFAAAGGLLGLAFTGQYVVLALRPVAVLGVAMYGLPNVIAAAKQLRHGQIGLPALYSAGLFFMLFSGMPFSSTVMAVLTQIWPRLAHDLMTRSQQRLFAVYRRRSTWARLVNEHGPEEIEIDIDKLRPGDLVSVHQSETIPVDGIVVSGFAAVDEEALSGVAGAVDKTPGDAVFATSQVRDGSLTIRVHAFDNATAAHHIGTLLPRARIDHLPSALEAERIANRNAKPALALALLSLLATRLPRPSQAIIRPDYATAPRLSAQLAALQDIGDGLFQGIFFRHVAALERLPDTNVYVFDDTAGLERQRIEVDEVFAAGVVSADAVLGYAAAAFPSDQNERASALHTETIARGAPLPGLVRRSRHAGIVRYRDSDDRLLEIAAPVYVQASDVAIPPDLAKEAKLRIPKPARGGETDPVAAQEPLLRPLWVLREGKVLGAITFRRKGPPEALDVIKALKARNRNAQFVHVSSEPQAKAEAIANRVGISIVFGRLDPAGKADILRTLGGRTLWIGDGAAPQSQPCIEASALSISVAGAAAAATDRADVVLLQPGLRNLVALRAIGRAHRARLAADYRVVYSANLLGVVGGLLFGAGSLESGLVSNAGTGLVYLVRQLQLNGLIARLDERQMKIILAAHGEAAPLFHEAADREESEDAQERRPVQTFLQPRIDFEGI